MEISSQSNPHLYLALVHSPVVNKTGEEITTSVTNLDIHDISRSSRTYGVSKYYLVTPVKMQHQLLARILGHWESDAGQDYNPDRHEALKLAQVVNSIEEAVADIEGREGTRPIIAVTAAKLGADADGMEQLKVKAKGSQRPVLLLFGTGHGLANRVLDQADVRLAGLKGLATDGYNHLSVRSAVAIYLDRWSQA